MPNPILERLAEFVNDREDTYEWMERATGVSRSILHRVAHGKGRFLSVESASKIAHAFGYELCLRRKK